MSIPLFSISLPLAVAVALSPAAAPTPTSQGGGGFSNVTDEPVNPPSGFLASNRLDFAELLDTTSSLEIQRVGWGDFSNDLTGALVAQASGSLYFSPVPYLLNSLSPVEPTASGVVDFAILDDIGTGHKLVSIDSRGLLYHASHSSGVGFEPPVVLETGAWASATQLKTFSQPSADTTFVIGLAADDKTLLLGRFVNDVWMPTPSVVLPLTVLDFQMFDYQDDGTLEVAAVFTAGVYVFNLQGVLVKRWTKVSLEGGIAPIKSLDDSQVTHTKLAWWYRNESTGGYEITVADSSGLQPPAPLFLAADPGFLPVEITPKSMSVGDYDLDGNEDVMLTSNLMANFVLRNRIATNPGRIFSNAVGDYDAFPASANPNDPKQGNARTVIANYNFAGADHPIVVNEEEEAVYLYERVPTQSAPVGAINATFDSSTLISPESTYYWETPGVGAKFNFALTIPEDVLGSGQDRYTHMQSIVFYQAGPTEPITSKSVDNTVYELHTLGNERHYIDVPLVAPGAQPGTFEPVEGLIWDDVHHHYWIMSRFLFFGSDPSAVPMPKPKKASKFFFVSMTVRNKDVENNDFLNYMAGIPGASSPVYMVNQPNVGGGTSQSSLVIHGGSKAVGGVIHHKTSGDFPPEAPPTPAPPVLSPDKTKEFDLPE